MYKVKLAIVCSAVQNLFCGNREDWGNETEVAYEFCEELQKFCTEISKRFGDITIALDENCTVGQIVERLLLGLQCFLKNKEGADFLIKNFGNVVLRFHSSPTN